MTEKKRLSSSAGGLCPEPDGRGGYGEAAQTCPIFPGEGGKLHWPLEDPAMGIGATDERLMTFRKVRDEIKTMIKELLKSA